MKKIILMAAFAIVSVGIKAQSTNDEIALVQSAYGIDKRQIVTQFMKFTEAENAAFWKEYDVYEAERKEIGKKRISNINDYAVNYDKLNDEKVKTLIHHSLEIQTDFAKLWKKAFDKMSKVISPIRTAQWLQVEMYLENSIRMEILNDIPMIGELEKSHK
jgi:hypothetical protein